MIQLEIREAMPRDRQQQEAWDSNLQWPADIRCSLSMLWCSFTAVFKQSTKPGGVCAANSSCAGDAWADGARLELLAEILRVLHVALGRLLHSSHLLLTEGTYHLAG